MEVIRDRRGSRHTLRVEQVQSRGRRDSQEGAGDRSRYACAKLDERRRLGERKGNNLRKAAADALAPEGDAFSRLLADALTEESEES